MSFGWELQNNSAKIANDSAAALKNSLPFPGEEIRSKYFRRVIPVPVALAEKTAMQGGHE